jgi:Ca2+-transporting ATPase
VTLALAFATKHMTAENLLVRVLGSCETMANASVVYMDKTGTLTQNVMTVVAGSVSIYGKFVQKLEDNQARTNAGEQLGVKEDESEVKRKHTNDFSIDQSQLNLVLSGALCKLFNEAIAVATVFEDTDVATGQCKFVGSKTKTALLQYFGWADYQKT